MSVYTTNRINAARGQLTAALASDDAEQHDIDGARFRLAMAEAEATAAAHRLLDAAEEEGRGPAC